MTPAQVNLELGGHDDSAELTPEELAERVAARQDAIFDAIAERIGITPALLVSEPSDVVIAHAVELGAAKLTADTLRTALLSYCQRTYQTS